MARMTQEEFDNNLKMVKEEDPLYFQFIVDFVHKKITREKVTEFCSWSDDERQAYLLKRYGGTV